MLWLRLVTLSRSSVACKKRSERTHEGGPCRLQLVTMKERKPSQNLLPLWSELDDDAPPIDVVAQAYDQTSLHQPVNQLDRTMMLKLEPLGHLTDRCFPPRGQSLERKQQLVLLRHEACLVRRLLAKVQKTPNLIAHLETIQRAMRR